MALTAETMSEIVVNREGRRARTVYLLAVLMAATIVGLLFVAHPAVAAAIKSDPVPQTDGRVSAIVVSGDTVYIGGSFTHVDGVPRSRLAAIDATDGSLLPWNPGANRHVRALVAAGSRIYAGGDFTRVGGSAHSRLAAVDATTGAVDNSWNPSANLEVSSLAALGDRLYVGGRFRVVSERPRSNLAAINKNTGRLTNWNPEANGKIRTLVPSPNGNRIYAGGNFSSINGKPRPNLAALNPTTGVLRGWTPDPKIDNDYEVFDLEVTNGRVHVAGGGRDPDGTAESFDATTGASVWRISSNGDFQAVALLNGRLYFGGHFVTLFSSGDVSRKRLVAVGANRGALNEQWQPKAWQGGVWAMTPDPVHGRIYAGGDFLSISGQPQHRFARLPL